MTLRFQAKIEERACVGAKSFFFVPDFMSTILYYDEVGMPKRYVPSAQLPNGEWAYSLSPFRDNPLLKGKALIAHAQLIKEMRNV